MVCHVAASYAATLVRVIFKSYAISSNAHLHWNCHIWKLILGSTGDLGNEYVSVHPSLGPVFRFTRARADGTSVRHARQSCARCASWTIMQNTWWRRSTCCTCNNRRTYVTFSRSSTARSNICARGRRKWIHCASSISTRVCRYVVRLVQGCVYVCQIAFECKFWDNSNVHNLFVLLQLNANVNFASIRDETSPIHAFLRLRFKWSAKNGSNANALGWYLQMHLCHR